MYTSFSLDTFSEIKAEKDYVYLFFNSLIYQDPYVSTAYYYGTRVEFYKSDFGYQFYGEIVQTLSQLNSTNIVTLDYTRDYLVTTTFDEIYGICGAGGSALEILGPTGSVTQGATAIQFLGSGISSVVATGGFVTVTVTGGGSGTAGTSGSSGTSGTSGSSGASGSSS